MKNYQITIGYKAIIQVEVKAKNEESAKEKAIVQMDKIQSKINSSKNTELVEDNFKADGVLDLDNTWNMVWE